MVVFAWISSQEKHLKNYIHLYSSLGWNSIVCHSQFLNLFFPDKAASLAYEVLKELLQELKLRPCPVVFASFSGGPKACMYKALQIIEGKCKSPLSLDEYQLVRDCLSGHVYDSSPVDFTSDLGNRFLLHPSVTKMAHPPQIASWMLHGFSFSLDSLFLNRFETQRAEYWQTLYASVGMGAPYLIFCSEEDDLAPYQIICNFGKRLQELGGDVKLVKWKSTPHVAHFRDNPIDYKAAVIELLGKASVIYSHKIRELEGEGMGLEGGTHDEISKPFYRLKRAAMSSKQSFQRVSLELNDNFFVPSSVEYHEDSNMGPVPDSHKESLIHVSSSPRANAQGVLGQILFDVCVPKNVEGWDLKASSSSNRPAFGSRRHTPFNPIKCIRRSKL